MSPFGGVTSGLSEDRISDRAERGMDLRKTIQDLYAEKEKLEQVIASLEELQRNATPVGRLHAAGKRRGRKSMGAQERLDVSERMKKYWAAQRGAEPEEK